MTDKAGVGYPCWAMGAVVGDYNNDGWPDLLVTCFGGVVLYRNNGDGTFTDVTREAGLSGDHMWATGAAFGDYDNDGWADLFVSHYVDFDLHNMAAFGSADICKYMGFDVQCGPRGLKGSPDNLYHNNHDGTFTDVSRKAGVSDERASLRPHRALVRLRESTASSTYLSPTTASPIISIRAMAKARLRKWGLCPAWASARAAPVRRIWASP